MTTKLKHPSACVSFDGPFSDLSPDGDEIPSWTVSMVDVDGEAIGEIFRFHSYDAGRTFALALSRPACVELIDDATED